jgi:DNA-directed RNA polymerase subunit E'/Rpb7
MDIFEKSCFSKKKIKLPVYIDPQYLDHSLEEHILNQTRQKLENTCIHEIGFISKVMKVNSILHNHILDIIPKTLFIVEFIILVFLPRKKKRIKLPASKILCHGIFYYHNINLRFFLPILFCPSFQYYPSSFLQSSIHESQKIQVNDFIDTIIIDSKYEYNGFSCILSLYLIGEGTIKSFDDNTLKNKSHNSFLANEP